MKRLSLIIALAGIFILSSCKKDWYCDCVVNSGLYKSEMIKDKTKSKAKSECNEGDGNVYGFHQECTLRDKLVQKDDEE